jgi:hypothetical protein
MHADETRINQLSERIIGCAFPVMNTLGTERKQHGITIRYDGTVVGE